MRNRKTPIILLCLLAGAALAQEMPAKVVQVATAERTEIAPTVAVPGTVFSRNDVQVTAGVTGQLLMVAEPGTFVQQGEPVALIDKRHCSCSALNRKPCCNAPKLT